MELPLLTQHHRLVFERSENGMHINVDMYPTMVDEIKFYHLLQSGKCLLSNQVMFFLIVTV